MRPRPPLVVAAARTASVARASPNGLRSSRQIATLHPGAAAACRLGSRHRLQLERLGEPSSVASLARELCALRSPGRSGLAVAAGERHPPRGRRAKTSA